MSESPKTEMLEAAPLRSSVRPAWFYFSNLSIEHRLPLLIGSLLLCIIIASIWASYRVVKEAALEVGSQRLMSLTQQLATLLQQSSVDLLNKTSIAGNDQAKAQIAAAQAGKEAGSDFHASSVRRSWTPSSLVAIVERSSAVSANF